MINYAVIEDYDERFAGVIGHSPRTEKVFYKVTSKFIDDVLKILFENKHYKTVQEGDIELNELVKKSDPHYLEIVLPTLRQYKVVEYDTEIDADLRTFVVELFEKKRGN